MLEGDVIQDRFPEVGGRSPIALWTVVKTFVLTLKRGPRRVLSRAEAV